MASTTWADGLEAVDYGRIVDRLAGQAETPMGVLRIRDLKPGPDAAELTDTHAALREGIRLLAAHEVSLRGAGRAGEFGARAESGAVLGGKELREIYDTLIVAERAMVPVREGEYPVLAAALASVTIPTPLTDRLGTAVKADGTLDDRASSALAGIRRRIRQEANQLDAVFNRILSDPGWAPYLQERVVTIRFGRRVVPVKNEFRNKVKGIVHDQSASGQTVFVEPMVAMEHQNRLTMLERDEADEIERILQELSALVGNFHEVLATVEERLAWLDRIFATLRLGRSMAGTLPNLGGSDLSLEDVRHPLLAEPVPISVALGADKSVLVITGPNTGGKTVALKTVGLVTAMALSGLLIPARDGSRVPLYERMWLDIGDEQSLEQNLSTFSGHLSRLIPMVESAVAGHLCLIDEIGSGTDPEEGTVLAEAMIEALAASGAHVLVTTHLGRLKLLAYNLKRVENAQVEFDRQSFRPTYRLLTGLPGSSHALYVARRLGMPEAILTRAESRIDPEAETMRRALRDLEDIAGRLRRHEAELLAREANLTHEREQVRLEAERLGRERESMRERGINTWRRQLDDLTRRFDEAVRATRSQDARDRQAAMHELREAFRAAQDLPPALKRHRGRQPQAVALETGDWVVAEGLGEPGRIVEIKGGTATVEVGWLKLKLPVSDVQKVEPRREAAPRPGGGRVAAPPRREAAGTEVDLRGMTVDDATYTVDRFLEDAVMGGVPWIRIIHGKGTGTLRRAIMEQLADDPRIVRYRLGGPGEGGDGVTIAYLEDPGEV